MSYPPDPTAPRGGPQPDRPSPALPSFPGAAAYAGAAAGAAGWLPIPTDPRPPTHGGWAACTIIFFFPLAFLAVPKALSITPAWLQGDLAAANRASGSVRTLGIIALIVGLLLSVLTNLV